MDINPTFNDMIAEYRDKVSELVNENIVLMATIRRMSVRIDALEKSARQVHDDSGKEE